MKKTLIVILMVVLGTAFAKAQKSKNNKQRDLYEIQVDGLGCPFCAYGLEKKFKEFKGIKDVAIDIETGDFSFTYPSSKPLTMQEVEEQVQKAGYTPKKAMITRADGTKESNQGTAQIEGSYTATELWVNGKCGMCKARIESTLNGLPQVRNATWDQKTKMLALEFIQEEITLPEIADLLAGVGHDTIDKQAQEEVYEALPPCCHYERSL